MSDLTDLKTPEALNEYCRRKLGNPIQKGKISVYPCPLGTHTRPHLEVSDYQSGGRWKCWACDRGGDIFDLAAIMEGLDGSREFQKVVTSVCNELGIAVPADFQRNAPEGRRKRHGAHPVSFTKKAVTASQKHVTASQNAPQEPQFLNPRDEAALEECRCRLRDNGDMAAALMKELGLNPCLAIPCTDSTLGMPLLGMSPDYRLLYLYTARDKDGNIRYTGAKLRRRPGQANLKLFLKEGEWIYGQSMDPSGVNPDTGAPEGGCKFISVIGRLFEPWGMEAARRKRTLVITEGESDCLAFLDCLEWTREAYQKDVDPETNAPYEDEQGSFEGLIPGVIAIPGVNGFKTGWNSFLTGKRIFLAMDSDKAGRGAAAKLKELLTLAGCAVLDWCPPSPYKDARTVLIEEGAPFLAMSLLGTTNKEGK